MHHDYRSWSRARIKKTHLVAKSTEAEVRVARSFLLHLEAAYCQKCMIQEYRGGTYCVNKPEARIRNRSAFMGAGAHIVVLTGRLFFNTNEHSTEPHMACTVKILSSILLSLSKII